MDIEIDDARARRTLGRLAGLASGGRYDGPGGAEGAAAFEHTMRAVGVAALEDLRANFDRQSQPGSDWPELSMATVVLRRRGGGQKIHSERDAHRKRQSLRKLRDTNILYLSLQPGGQDNILEVSPADSGVWVGTRQERAKLHQDGGSSRFVFGEDEERRFDQNVAAVKRGRRRPAKGGGRRRWKAEGKESPWNEFYFRMRGALRKMHGRTFQVPARPIVVADALDLPKYAGIVLRKLRGFGFR